MEAARDPIADLAALIRGDRRLIVASTVAAAFVHLGIAAGVMRARVALPGRREEPPTQLFDVELPKPSPQSATSVTPPAAAEIRMRRPARTTKPAPAHPPPAEAAAALIRQPAPDDPVDLTADEIVTGSASSYTGGQTSATGDRRITPAVASVGSQLSRTGPFESGAVPDRSRRASVAGGDDWRCPFPPEADTDRVDDASAIIQVEVDAGGVVNRVDVLSDPGHGFGREAQRCAMSKHWTPALDRGGNAVDGKVTIRVRFYR